MRVHNGKISKKNSERAMFYYVEKQKEIVIRKIQEEFS